jgi:hypothetical protein
LLDAISRRYGKLPSELLALPVDEWSINVAVALEGIKTEKAK